MASFVLYCPHLFFFVYCNMKYPSKQKWTVTSTFQDHLNDPSRSSFPGTDYAGFPMWGDEILSPEDGSLDIYKDNNGTIYAVVINTPSGYRWDFLHVQSVIGVTPYNPKAIQEGTGIALVGNTGFVRPAPTPDNPYAGTHVHVSIRDAQGRFLDPEPILEKLWTEQEKPTTDPCETLRHNNEELKNMLDVAKAERDEKAEVILEIQKDYAAQITKLKGELQAALAMIPEAPQPASNWLSLTNLKKAWHEWVDNNIKIQFLNQFFKYTWVYYFALLIPTAIAWAQNYKGENTIIAQLAPMFISGGVAVLQFLLTNFDKNKDGKIDLDELT